VLTTEAKTFEPVERIDTTGRYFFSTAPRETGDNGVILGYRPNIGWELSLFLKQKSPNLRERIFTKLSVVGDVYTPSRLEDKLDWKPRIHDGIDYLVHQDQITRFFRADSYNHGWGIWKSELSDIELRIIKNDLVKAQPEDRNGKLKITLSGTAPHGIGMGWVQDEHHWKGHIDLTGKNPGQLVKAGVDYLNELKSSNNLPLWKKVLD